MNSRVATAIALRRRAYTRDLSNLCRYGPHAPRYGERLWIDPCEVGGNPFPKIEGYLKHDTGRIVKEWPEAIPDITDNCNFSEALTHWRDGLSWEECGRLPRWRAELETGRQPYGCSTEDDLLARLDAWDRMFDSVKADGALLPRTAISRSAFREVGGIGIHVGPNGQLYKGRDGHHRFAAALAAGLEVIPVVVGVVHQTAISRLPDMRRVSGLFP